MTTVELWIVALLVWASVATLLAIRYRVMLGEVMEIVERTQGQVEWLLEQTGHEPDEG